MSAPTVPLGTFFDRQWETYRKVVANNYMFHREFADEVRKVLNRPNSQPSSLLDLGCGDSSFARAITGDTILQKYVGVDLSAVALKIAEGTMRDVAPECSFMEGDIAGVTSRLADHYHQFHVLLASYSVHHLNTVSKAALFRSVGKVLASDGLFVMIDVVRQPGESRNDYVEHYIAWIRDQWKQMDAEQVALIADHIRSSDFPETANDLHSMARQNGLEPDTTYISPHGTEAMFCWRKR